MKCKQCKYVKVCMAQADMLGQVFDVNYDGEHGCTDFTPFTNADRIRAMSDEELAEFLNECEGKGYLDSSIALDGYGRCVDMLDWLKEPAKEVDDG